MTVQANRVRNVAAYLFEVMLLVLVSFLAGQIGILFGFEQGNISLLWFQTGIIFAVLLVYGRRLWVGALIGALLTNLSSDLNFTMALIDALSVCVSSLLAIALLQRVDFRPDLRRVKDVIAFVIFAVLLISAIDATVGTLGIYFNGILQPNTVFRLWLTWVLGEGMGILIISSMIFAWSERPLRLPAARQIKELTALLAVFLVVAWLIFSQNLKTFGFSPLAYLMFPFLVAAALRYSQRSVITLTFFTSIIAMSGTLLQLEASSRLMIWNALLLLWAYLTTLSITALLLGATLNERRDIQRTLGSLEERFSKAFHSASIAMGITSLDEGYYVEVNDKYCRVTGYTRAELMGHTPMEMGLWYDPRLRAIYVEKLKRGESIVEVETRVHTKSGEIRHALMSMEAIELGGKPHLLGMMHDVTERRRAEEALRDSEQRYRQLVEGIDDSIFVHDVKGKILDVNEAVCRQLGYSREELLSMNIRDLEAPEFASGFQDRMKERLEVGYLNQIQGVLMTKQGQPIFVDVSSKLITYNGQVGILTVDRDVTLRRQTEEALRESEARYRAVVEDQTEFIARIAPDWQIKFVNEAFCRYYGKSRDELLNSYFRPKVHPDDYQLVRRNLKSLGQDVPLVTYEHRVVLDDGEIRWQQWTNRAFTDETGRITEYQFVGKDITEVKEMENQRLRAALEHEKVQLLADFIATASHDFRTPLSVINTSAYLLNRIQSGEGRERHFQNIQAQIHNIERLVDGLLMMSRLDRGDVFRLQTIDLNRLIRQIEVQTKTQVDRKHIAFTLDLASDLPAMKGDEEWLYRSIYRLVENALQYTPDGGAVVVCTRSIGDSLIVEVRDNGSGITEQDLPYIFDRLYRSEVHRPIGGQGLGLSIAKKIVEGHNGTIEVESIAGVGSTFRIVLPLTAGAIPADSTAETSPIL